MSSVNDVGVGLGFLFVIINICNYFVKCVDFRLEVSWYDVV